MNGGSVEELVLAAYGTLERVRQNLPEKYALVLANDEDVVIDALKRHGKHLATHNIAQRHIDPIKLACWIGGSLLSKVEVDHPHQCEVIIDAIIRTLDELLIHETDEELVLPTETRELLRQLLLQEKFGDKDHGIWMNGLFIAFHCCVVGWKAGKTELAS